MTKSASWVRSGRGDGDAGHIRGHWSIENSLRHVLGVTFAKEASRIRQGSAPKIPSDIRRMSLHILKLDTTACETIRSKCFPAGSDAL